MTLEQLEQRVAAIAPARRYDPFSRQLSYDDLMVLYDVWRPLLKLESCEKSHIRYWQHRVTNIEQNCAGRMAGNLHEAVLRMMVAVATQGSSFRMLEIGTLFGVNAAATWDIAACTHDTATLTIVDPLDGYYGASRRDVATGLKITRQTVERNLRHVGVPVDAVQIVQGMSESPHAIAKAAAGTYNYMFIDGDHSYEGVRRDWANYGRLLEPGGYVLFDNYRDPSWPEVTRAVDEIIEDATMEYLGHAWCSAVFRKPL
ncbi:MAG TPA: class I SAM-dependent methyltransferase [Tepidisphaeraceae bacterium]|jgi:hypothetical protein